MEKADEPKYGSSRLTIMASVIAILLVALVLAIVVPQLIKADKLDIKHASFSESSFVLEEHPADINPGRAYVVYTNYACPYCAGFYNESKGYDYTTRLLLRDNDNERFNSQALVSAYMLKLYREDVSSFAEAENWLFNNQGDWVFLDNQDVLDCLNGLTGREWTENDLQDCYKELEEVKKAAPDDLEFVPALFADGKCYNEYMLSLFEG